MTRTHTRINGKPCIVIKKNGRVRVVVVMTEHKASYHEPPMKGQFGSVEHMKSFAVKAAALEADDLQQRGKLSYDPKRRREWIAKRAGVVVSEVVFYLGKRG